MPILPSWTTWKTKLQLTSPPVNDLPLRAELFSLEQLTRHARALAQVHRATHEAHSNNLLSHLDQNEQCLRAFNRSTLAVTPNRRITPAAEWLLDNFYLIEEQILMVRRHLPAGYSRALPQLLNGASIGLPRIYDVGLELISHADAQLEGGSLGAFVAAYQTVSPLKLGELWAIPIMLKLGLIENLQRITTRLILARAHRDLADEWVDRLQAMAESNPSRLVVVVADMAKANLPTSSAFVAEFCQRLSRYSPALHLARSWLEQRLAEQGLTIELLVHRENQEQASDQVSVSHSITSLRFLSAFDWKEFIESQSLVERTLRNDPAGVYVRMDFSTRDQYRHAVETYAGQSALTELQLAALAVELARAGAGKIGLDERAAHVGFYLIGRGRAQFEQRARVRRPARIWAERAVLRFPSAYYFGGIGAITALGMFWLLDHAWAFSAPPLWALVVLVPLWLLCLSQFAVAVINWFSSLLVQPQALPRMDFSEGIKPEEHTAVVIPTLLQNPAGVQRLLETLELHFLANRDPNLHFALLTDFTDADAETLPDDDALLQRARTGIEQLNLKYAPHVAGAFLLFHRARRWNSQERRWMGYERKRGKLAEFNAYLRGGARSCFSHIVGEAAGLLGVKYVITLDADTQLPHGAARQLVGTMAHPLNRPRFDEKRNVIVEGHGILQPRLGVSLPGARRSWFARIFSGEAGIDPYTRAVSDLYQDLFQEGSFIGKGIYDVDAIERVFSRRFPENRILSHDLLEGCYARSALVSDVEFFESHPSRYSVEMARRHRWIRGDWQILPWLSRRVPGLDGTRSTNPLSLLSQWKIFDNLRRSLVPVAMVLLVLSDVLLNPDSIDARGLILVLITLIVPGLLAAYAQVLGKTPEMPWPLHLRGTLRMASRQLGQSLLTFVLLPCEAWVSLDAIVRTLIRLCLTRRRLLEWQTSSDSERGSHLDLANSYAKFWAAPTLMLGVGAYLFERDPAGLPLALPLLVLWFGAPAVTWAISRTIPPRPLDLTAEQLLFLRRAARKTWHYFETFVTAGENALPPDNVQETPVEIIASRTSPTNLGLALLANLGAHDFGYLSTGGLIRRTQTALDTMERLERFRGHFFNWYDTRTLQPLYPLYVSSVDSGNLAGHLLTLGSGLRELADTPIFTPQIFAGLLDTTQVLLELSPPNASLATLAASLDKTPERLRDAYTLLHRAAALAAEAETALQNENAEIKRWAKTLRSACEDQLANLVFLAPWLSSPAESNPYSDTSTLRALPGEHALARLQTLEALAKRCDELAVMDFRFLYNEAKDLFSIGFHVGEHRLETGCYDLLASEARLGSYVAIALGQVSPDHWFSLGRQLVSVGGEPILVSWSGSMFEYLMPMLVMPSHAHTLLDHTCAASVRQQILYGALHGVPWGVSESGYNRTDVNLNYQYRAFGIPGMGLKRGLAEDLVIAPYASVLALMVAPREACENLQRLQAEGQHGAYGFYEAVDYTPARLPPDESRVTVRSFMVHHESMSLLALVSLLRGQPMQRRFMACPPLRAASLLLQERVPRVVASVFAEDLSLETTRALSQSTESTMRVFTRANTATPEVHLLSNGRYHVAISNAGGGYSRWRDLAVTRWREDATRDPWGSFIFLRDATSGACWSATYQPTARPAKNYEAIFTQACAEFRQQHDHIALHLSISVSPEDDVELRRVTLTNHGATARELELTSYAEVVLAPAAADEAHPAFSNLFVQTEFDPKSSALLCTRRARSPDENPPWLLHLWVTHGGQSGPISCETDRARFLGRGATRANAAALQGPHGPLSNTTGPVLDPIVSLRRTLTLAPHASVTFTLVTGVAETREAALGWVGKYQNPLMVERAFDLAWTHNQVTLRHLNATETEAQLFGRMAGALLYADQTLRASRAVIRSNRRGQNNLWSYGISGDAPLVLLRISDGEKIELVRQLIQAHSYWRLKGLVVELLILNEDVSVYRQPLHDQITRLVSSGIEAVLLDKPGGIFVRQLEQVSSEDRTLFEAVARISLSDELGSLAEQLERRPTPDLPLPKLIPTHAPRRELTSPLAVRDLIFNNGLGGFTRDGHEYVITLQPGQNTPAPWVNVIANPSFGTVVSESGGAYTWLENAHEFRLTPWHNDPIRDTSGEALYLRDEQTGQIWSPTPSPARGATPYVIRHGFGYSVFEHTEHGITSELWVYVAIDAPVKFSTLKVKNISGRPRRLSLTSYCEWVLGDSRTKNHLHIVTKVDLKTGALLARNAYNAEFAERIAFIDVNDDTRTFTGDRREFIGRNGDLSQPAALKRARLSGNVGAGFDPCGALQVAVDLAEGQTREITFRFGAGRSNADVQELIQRFRPAEACISALEQVWSYWNRTLGTINVDTPDAAVNTMANGWLLYQTLSCRMWARSGFYQSGGAYGFRDQLQDAMALVHAEPALLREHLLRAAARQFREGDVQHWWHPPKGRGVRTHFADDLLWLPLAMCRYVGCVGDIGVLDEVVPFLEARAVKPDEEAYYDLPNRSEETATLYQHGVRAIERALKFGEHGLPLMGCGDWNDGMNRVGHQGRGESIWLAFFLCHVLDEFAALALRRDDSGFAARCRDHAQQLRQNIELHAWDGNWYRRAYFDNGEPLGSQQNAECQIDSLPQSWSVLGGGTDPERSRLAMDSFSQRLVRRADNLVQLFDPPFDRSALNPGYIKGYVPGVRENGGQYTHAAIWAAMAFAKMGEPDRAWELFNLLNPIQHGATPKQIALYKVEPYVVAADVYSRPPHTGRGGWTWYTGSAAWMYRLLLETLLGINVEADRLRLTPLMPKNWTTYKIHYHYRQTVYHITINRLPADTPGSPQLIVDGQLLAENLVPLQDDHREHFVELTIR